MPDLIGKLDRQTGMGKALDGILRVGEKCQVPVIALGGAVEATEALNRMGFTAVLPILPFPVSIRSACRTTSSKRSVFNITSIPDCNSAFKNGSKPPPIPPAAPAPGSCDISIFVYSFITCA